MRREGVGEKRPKKKGKERREKKRGKKHTKKPQKTTPGSTTAARTNTMYAYWLLRVPAAERGKASAPEPS